MTLEEENAFQELESQLAAAKAQLAKCGKENCFGREVDGCRRWVSAESLDAAKAEIEKMCQAQMVYYEEIKRLRVNPEHLRVMTIRENILLGTGPTAKNAKKTHCPKGHEYTKDNIVGAFRNARECRRCSYDRTNTRKKNKRRSQSALDGGKA